MRRPSAKRVSCPRCGSALLVALILGAMATTRAFAQSATASVSGIVTDDTGGALPGVTVTIANKANGVTHTLVTGPRGGIERSRSSRRPTR